MSIQPKREPRYLCMAVIEGKCEGKCGSHYKVHTHQGEVCDQTCTSAHYAYKCDPWVDFYKSRLNNRAYERYFEQKYAPFLDLTYKLCKKHDSIAEIGCGTGLVSALLAPKVHNSRILLVDRSGGMLANASKRPLGASPRVLFCKADIRYGLTKIIQPWGSEVAFSHGVLEHFSDPDIKNITSGLTKAGIDQIHYVPTNKYRTQSFGDERLLSPGEWKKLLPDAKITVFNHGLDLCLQIRH